MPLRQLLSIVTYCTFSWVMVTTLSAVEIEGNRGESPPGNLATPNPANPFETVQFTLNTNSTTYGNECTQRNAFDGNLSLEVSDATRSINLVFVEPAPLACFLIYAPVTGVQGEIGPLSSGSWVIQDDFGNSIDLLVVSPGDANRDGLFGTRDLVDVFQAGEYEDNVAQNSTWEEGDWNGDSEFTTTDIVVAFQHYSPGGNPVVSVPEPTVGVMGVFAIFVLSFHTRRV